MDINEKIQKIIEAAGDGVKHISVKHDDGCPAIKTKNLLDCTCDPDIESIAVN